MESIIALEELIKENESKVALQKRQLADHESGEHKLSAMAEASTENSLEIASELLAKYKSMLERILAEDQEELEEKERLVILAQKKKYFDAQGSRIKINKEHSSDSKLEVMRIIGELPTDVQFEDEELFEVATKSIELALPDLKELSQKLDSIKKEFQTFVKKSQKKDLQEMGTIDFLIPVIVLHFHVLLSNIKQNIQEKNDLELKKQQDILKQRQEAQEKLLQELMEKEKQEKENAKNEENEGEDSQNQEESKKEEIKKEDEPTVEVKLDEEPLPPIKELVFSGFPKYQDWWIRELWVSHQAYFALYKWKDIINNLCMTMEQKKAWSIIFDRWVFIKKLLNDKGSLAFNYIFAFDSLLISHAEIEEELEKENILSMELIVNEITKKEDFSKNAPFHNTNTPYLKFKQEKLQPKKEDKKGNKEDESDISPQNF